MNYDPNRFCTQCLKIKPNNQFRWIYWSVTETKCCAECFERIMAERQAARKELERITE